MLLKFLKNGYKFLWGKIPRWGALTLRGVGHFDPDNLG